MRRRYIFNVLFFALFFTCFLHGVYSQPSESIQLLPLGNALLMPIGRSSLDSDRFEIRLNEQLVSFEKIYDGYGGYWAKVSSGDLAEDSVLTVRYIRKMDNTSTCRNNNDTDAAWISPSRFIDSDNRSILEQALKIYDDTAAVEDNVAAISSFVTGYLTFDQNFHRHPASISASQTLFQRKGVCINFSRLFIALCRANGIPARSVSGVVLNIDQPDQYDFHHEWAEFMDDEGVWHPLDLTYTQVMNLSDIRYTDLVYAAEDHPYFPGSTNDSLKAGRPVVLENGDIILFHYNPIFRGAKDGFVLKEDHRPDYFVIEKALNIIKRDENIIIRQSSDSSIERCESPENLEELVCLQNQIENSPGVEDTGEFVPQIPEWLKYYYNKEFHYEQSVFNTVKSKFEINSQGNELLLTLYNRDNIPTVLKAGLSGTYFLNKNEQDLIMAAKASFEDNTIIWNTVIPRFDWAAKYIYSFSEERIEVDVVDINGTKYSTFGFDAQ